MDSETGEPLSGDTPYEILGVVEDDSKEEIKSQKNSLVEEYRQKSREARAESDNQKFKDAMEALEVINPAWEWIENHHKTN